MVSGNVSHADRTGKFVRDCRVTDPTMDAASPKVPKPLKNQSLGEDRLQKLHDAKLQPKTPKPPDPPKP